MTLTLEQSHCSICGRKAKSMEHGNDYVRGFCGHTWHKSRSLSVDQVRMLNLKKERERFESLYGGIRDVSTLRALGDKLMLTRGSDWISIVDELTYIRNQIQVATAKEAVPEPKVTVEVNRALKPGDVVVMKSGGPRMTINSIDNPLVCVIWFNDNKMESQLITPSSIELATSEDES